MKNSKIILPLGIIAIGCAAAVVTGLQSRKIASGNAPADAITATGTAQGMDGDVSVSVVFDSSKIYSLTVTEQNETPNIGTNAVDGCHVLRKAIIPDSCETVGAWAFYNCSGLRSVRLSEQTEAIARGTFSGCSRLESIEVPESVKTPELCLEAVRQDGAALEYVPEALKTPKLCLEAV